MLMLQIIEDTINNISAMMDMIVPTCRLICQMDVDVHNNANMNTRD